MSDPIENEVIAPVDEDTFSPETIAAEIEKGVANVAAEVEAEKALREGKKPADETPAEEALVEEGEKPEEGEKKPVEEKKVIEFPAIEDSLIERAVFAGMTIAEAKEFANPAALERVVGLIESRSAPAADKPAPVDEKDPLDDIPVLDPEVYDEKLIAIVDALKGVVKTQRDEIKALGQARTTDDAQASVEEGTNWFDSQIEGLGDDFVDVLGKGTIRDIAKGGPEFQARAALARKVEALNAGYNATGEKVSRDQVFKEALSLLHPGKGEAKKAKATAKAAAEREAQLLNRAGRNKTTVHKSVEQEVADEINKKFFVPDE